jgi:hypothetical protein
MSRRFAGRKMLVAFALAAAGVASACSGSAATPVPATPTPAPASAGPTVVPTTKATATSVPLATEAPLPDPCSLLTQDEADGLAGVKLGAPLPEGTPPTNCVWPTPLTGSVAQVEVGVGDGAKKFFDIDKITLAHDFTQIPGIGDEAWQESDTVFVRTGSLWFSLHLVKLDTNPNDPANMLTLAKAIVTRVGR